MMRVAAKVSRAMRNGICPSFSRLKSPLEPPRMAAAPPLIRQLSSNSGVFTPNPVAVEMIKYATSLARDQKTEESYGRGLLVLEQCESSQVDDNSKALVELARSTLLFERGSHEAAIERLGKLQDLSLSSIGIKVAASEALVGIYLEHYRDDAASAVAELALQVLGSIRQEIGDGGGFEVLEARIKALKGLIELLSGNLESEVFSVVLLRGSVCTCYSELCSINWSDLPSFSMPMSNPEKERLESVEKSLEEMQAAVAAANKKLEKVDTIEAMLSALMKKLGASHPSPPDLDAATSQEQSGLADSSTSDHHPPPLATPADATPASAATLAAPLPSFQSPKLELSTFDGSDPMAWLGQAEQYFLVHRTPARDKVQIALAVMAGRAMFWATGVLRRAPSLNWEAFSRDIVERFGDTLSRNVFESMHATQQTGSFDDYLALFEERLTLLPSLSQDHILGMFLGGLQSTVRDRITEPEAVDLHTAIRAARRISKSVFPSLLPARPPAASSGFGRPFQPQRSIPPPGDPPPQPTAPASVPPQPASLSGPPQNRNTRHLTTAEENEYRAQGKCFKCGLKFVPGHRSTCPARSLRVIVEASDDDADDPSPVQPCGQGCFAEGGN